MVCSGKRAGEAVIYPFQLCHAVLPGFRRQLEADGKMVPGQVGMFMGESVELPALHIGITEWAVKQLTQE